MCLLGATFAHADELSAIRSAADKGECFVIHEGRQESSVALAASAYDLPSSDKQVVLGLITTKHGELENPEGVKARLEEAARYVAKEQICLSPQCGFASTEEGNSLSEAQQWDKVRLVTKIASDVW